MPILATALPPPIQWDVAGLGPEVSLVVLLGLTLVWILLAGDPQD